MRGLHLQTLYFCVSFLWKSILYIKVFYLEETISVLWKIPQSNRVSAHLIQNDTVKLFRKRHIEDLWKWLENTIYFIQGKTKLSNRHHFRKDPTRGKENLRERYVARTVGTASDYSQFRRTKEPCGGPWTFQATTLKKRMYIFHKANSEVEEFRITGYCEVKVTHIFKI